jgi:DUF4097 and DUF4098 domain-containing protein YvlB
MSSTGRIAVCAAALLLVPLSLSAKCPITPNGTLVVRAEAGGNLIVDTTASDTVEVELSNRQTVREECTKDAVSITQPGPLGREIPDWHIRVPKSVSLDLTTFAGSISMNGDTDGKEITLRSTGGSVKALHIKGNASIITQGGEIAAGNVGGNAELNSGRSLVVGDVGGSARLTAGAGDIVAGFVKGKVEAETGGGNITINESDGRMDATTRLGSITVLKRVRGPFQGKTESGAIRVEQAGSWVRAETGSGDITIRLVPESPEGDNSVTLQTSVGNILLFLPEKMKATLDATISKSAFSTSRFFSNLPSSAWSGVNKVRNKLPGGPEQIQQQLNGGGSLIKLTTSSGRIELKGN